VEDPPGQGPLAAVAAGTRRLRELGWNGPAIVVATDLPGLTPGLLAWLAGHPSPRSVIPMANGVAQTLCARYAAVDLDIAVELVAAGRRALRDLLDDTRPLLAGPEMWEAAAGGAGTLLDIDTPTDLGRWQATSS
jgi:molybdopterin-guanine dinucleotide biosynthesis protein A